MNNKIAANFLKLKKNREKLISIIDNGFKNKSINVTKDPEVEKFQREFLVNWDDLEKMPECAEDLKGLNQEDKKEKIKELKAQFCDWVSGQDAIAEGFSYAFNKKEQMKEHIGNAGKNAASKVKAGIKAIVGSNKVGRNDLCPCGSGMKYKKCCIHKKPEEEEQ